MSRWEVRKLGEVYDVRDGTHDSPKYQQEGYPLITSKNLKANGLSFENIKYISEADYKKINERSAVHKGDVLLAMIGTIGNPIVVEIEPEFAIKNVALVKVPKNQNSYFLKYYLETEYVRSKMQREAKGTTQKFVGLGYLRTFPIALPPLSEQKRIVAVLDQAFEGIDRAIANTKKNLTNTRELFESYLNAIFTQKGEGWAQNKLSEVCEKITDGTHQTPKYFETGYVFLSSRNVTSGTVDWNNVKYIDEVQHVAMQKRVSPQLDDILLAKNGTTGVAALVDKDIDFDIYVSLALLRPLAVILPRFMLHFVNSPVAKEQFNKRLKGIGVPNLHLKEIREVTIYYPEVLTEQERIVARIDELAAETQRLEAIYQRKLAALNELKQSILQKAFTGELTADTTNQTTKAVKEVVAA